MTLPKFNNNDSQSASKFIANFDALREIAQWDNHAAAKHFQFLLTEGPSDWFQTLDEYTKNDYNLLKQIFLQNFDSSRNNTFNLLETYNRLQKPDEKVEKYLAALYKLFANNKDMSEKSKVVIFLKGLKPKIRDFVITTNPITLADASASAKLKESLLNNSSDSIPGTTLNLLSQLKQSETEQKLNTITNEIKNIISYLGNNDNRNDTANNNARLKQNYSRHIYDNYKLSQNNQPEISDLQNAIQETIVETVHRAIPEIAEIIQNQQETYQNWPQSYNNPIFYNYNPINRNQNRPLSNHSPQHSRTNFQRNQTNFNQNTPRCNYCKKLGHHISECWLRPQNNTSRPINSQNFRPKATPI